MFVFLVFFDIFFSSLGVVGGGSVGVNFFGSWLVENFFDYFGEIFLIFLEVEFHVF